MCVCVYGRRVGAIWRLKSDVNQPRMQYFDKWLCVRHHHAESVTLDVFRGRVRMDAAYRWSLFSSQIKTHKLLKIDRLWRLRKGCRTSYWHRTKRRVTRCESLDWRKHTSERWPVVLSRPVSPIHSDSRLSPASWWRMTRSLDQWSSGGENVLCWQCPMQWWPVRLPTVPVCTVCRSPSLSQLFY